MNGLAGLQPAVIRKLRRDFPGLFKAGKEAGLPATFDEFYLKFLPMVCPDAVRGVDHRHIQYLRRLVDQSQRDGQWIFVAIPPQHTKTWTISVCFAVWLVLKYRVRVVLVASSKERAAEVAGDAARLAAVAGGQFVKRQAVFWSLTNGGSFKAVGITSQRVGFSADAVIFDDLFAGYDDYLSRLKRERIWRAVASDFLPRLNEPRIKPWVAFPNTRYGPDDVWGRVEKEEAIKAKFKFINLPVYAVEGDPLGRNPGELLCPAMHSEEKIGIIKKLMGKAFDTVYQGMPMPGDGGMFPAEKWVVVPAVPNGLIGFVRAWDRACLVAGTQIDTLAGRKPIEEVTTSDYVMTSHGYRKVVWSGITKHVDSTVAVGFDSGAVVEGTFDHRIWTENRGWVPLGELAGGDKNIAISDDWESQWLRQKTGIQTSKVSHSTECITQGRLDGNTTRPAFGARNASDPSLTRCTVPYGDFTTATFPKGITYITRTRTGTTTISATLSACLQKSTHRITVTSFGEVRSKCDPSAKHLASGFGKIRNWLTRLPSNAARMLPGGGRLLMAFAALAGRFSEHSRRLLFTVRGNASQLAIKKYGPSQVQSCLFAGIAAKSFRLNTAAHFAPNHALPIGGVWSSVNTPVKFAASDLNRVLFVKAMPSIVGLNAEKRPNEGPSDCGRSVPVYDLEVDGVHEFFANGILVHNSTSGGGDYSAGVLVARDRDGNSYVLDVLRGQWSVSDRNAVIRQTAVMDENRYGQVTVVIEQEPGSSGVESAELAVKMLAGHRVIIEKPTAAKEIRAQPFADQQQVGNVRLLAANWNRDFMDEAGEFPLGKHDDQIDAASFAWMQSLKADKVKLGDWVGF